MIIENPPIEELKESFTPMDGFGGVSLDKESWWMITTGMVKRAAQYDIFNEVESFARENGLYNFAMNLVKGQDVAKLSGTNYMARKAFLATPSAKELHAAKLLEENGHRVFFTPVNKTRGMKNYDAIIDGRLGDFKKLDSFKQIKARLGDAEAQRASVVCLEPPMKGHTQADAERVVRSWFNSKQKMIQYVDTVLLIWGGQIIPIKK